jgi:hypothetical protein
MGVVLTIALVLVAWCACALVVGVIIGRAIALKPEGEVVVPRQRVGTDPQRVK